MEDFRAYYTNYCVRNYKILNCCLSFGSLMNFKKESYYQQKLIQFYLI